MTIVSRGQYHNITRQAMFV